MWKTTQKGLFICSLLLGVNLISWGADAAPLQILYEFQTTKKESGGILKSLMGKNDESSVVLETKVLSSLTLNELSQQKLSELSETDPASGSKSTFKGVSLSALVDQSASGLSAADRSHIDLVILKSKSGKSVLLPRAFLVKYPTIQIALQKDGKPIGDEAPRVIVPASNWKIQKEGLLLDPLFISNLAEVRLTSYQFHYADLYLKKRTDPAAMRGEKLFMSNCVGCHSLAPPSSSVSMISTPDRVAKLADSGHPKIEGLSNLKSILDAKQMRSLVSYLEAFRFQSSASRQ